MKSKKAPAKTTGALAEGFVHSGPLMADAFSEAERKCSAPDTNHDPKSILPRGADAPGRLTLICGQPAMGKSAYLMAAALELRARGLGVAVFLTEAAPAEFLLKAACAQARVSVSGLRHGRLRREDWPSLTRAAGLLAEPGLYFYDRPRFSAGEVARAAACLKTALGESGNTLDAVLVDSLNYLHREDELEQPLEELKEMTRRLKVIALCAQKVRSTPETFESYLHLGDVRAAGVDERHTDAIYALVRQEYWHRDDPTVRGKASLRLVYPFFGERGAELLFDHSTMSFSPVPLFSPAGETTVF